MEQIYQSIEIIIIDDGSSDDTRSVVKAFGSPVRYIYQSNAGVSAARNRGIKEARGEFIAFLDSDDYWFEWKLEAQIKLMRLMPDVGMIWTDMEAVEPNGKVLSPAYLRKMYSNHQRRKIETFCTHGGMLSGLSDKLPSKIAGRPFYYGYIFSEMMLGNLVHTSTTILRRTRLDAVGGFDESLKGSGEDYEFHLNTCYHGLVAFIDAASIQYRVGDADQLTASPYGEDIACNNLKTVQKWLDKGRDKISLSPMQIRNHVASCYEWVGGEKYLAGDFWGARMAQLESLRLRPWQPWLWLHFAYHLMPAFLRHAIRTARRHYQEAGKALRSGR